MRNHPLFILLESLAVGVFLHVAAQADWREDYAQVTQGLDAVRMDGTAGGVAILGRNAFTLVQSAKRQSIAGAGYQADKVSGGRLVAMAHTSLVSSGTPEMRRWLRNVLVWAGRKDQPTLLVLGGSSKEWIASGLNVREAPKTWTPDVLGEVDCVALNLHALPADQFGAVTPDLVKFSQAGGGIILSATPWAAKKEALDLAAALLQPAGLGFLKSGPSDTTYSLAPPSPLNSALRGMDALGAERAEPPLALSLSERQAACKAVESCIAADLVPRELEEALRRLHQHTGWTRMGVGQPLRRTLKPLDALMARFEGWWLTHQAPDKMPVHPLAADYPGLPVEGAPQRKSIVFNAHTGPDKLINHGDRTRIPTGLYAPPGGLVRVLLPREATTAGLAVEIGIHTDKNWNLAAWRRFPEISTTTALSQLANDAANSFGGLISILVPADCPLGEVEVIVEGGVLAPVYELGAAGEGFWRQDLRSPGAWGYIQTPLWTGYFSRAQFEAMENPEKVASYWHNVVGMADRYLGYAAWRRRAESMLVDRDVFVGYGHAGYPVMMAYGAETEENQKALLERGPRQGDWGFLHELGHTFQDSFDGNYTIATHAEVDVNLVPGLILQKVHDRTCWDNDAHPTFNADSRLADWEVWKGLPSSEQTWAKACTMKVAYDFYFTLAECFGWELYEKAFGRWMKWLQAPGRDEALDGISAPSPNAKRDRFFTLFCEESGHNLLPFFQKYGLGRGEFALSDSVKRRVETLPLWEGNRPIGGITGPKEIVLPAVFSGLCRVGKFTAQDPDPGTVFTYKIVAGNEGGAFEIQKRTGVLTQVKAVASGTNPLTIEVQDNCIPLSVARTQCLLQRE